MIDLNVHEKSKTGKIENFSIRNVDMYFSGTCRRKGFGKHTNVNVCYFALIAKKKQVIYMLYTTIPSSSITVQNHKRALAPLEVLRTRDLSSNPDKDCRFPLHFIGHPGPSTADGFGEKWHPKLLKPTYILGLTIFLIFLL